jgi:hypothetical protein
MSRGSSANIPGTLQTSSVASPSRAKRQVGLVESPRPPSQYGIEVTEVAEEDEMVRAEIT